MSEPSPPVLDDAPPATAGGSVRPIDKALLGGAPERVGRFEYDYGTDTWTWSDTVARIHGYEPGEVTPTTDLVLGHKHPDDVAQVRGLLEHVSAPFSSRHRIITTGGDIRSVVVVGSAVTGPEGEITATRGFYIDITASVDAEVQRTVSDELSVIVAHREVIDQAKGMLQLLYDLDADAAFGVLRWRSQDLNVKLHVIAQRLVTELPKLVQLRDGPRTPVDCYLMTLEPSDGE